MVPSCRPGARAGNVRVRAVGGGSQKGWFHAFRHQAGGGELTALELGEGQFVCTSQQPGRHLRTQAGRLGRGDVRGIVPGIDHARQAVDPWRIVGVLDEASRRIERLGQAFIGFDLGGDQVAAVAGDNAGPEGVRPARLVAGAGFLSLLHTSRARP